MQVVYAYYQKGDNTLDKAEKELFHSISKAHELYHAQLLLLVELRLFAEKRIETGRSKLRPTQQDLNPNTRFIDNQLLAQLADNNMLLSYIKKTGLSWVNHPDVIKGLFQHICASDVYKDYMDLEVSSYETDKKFILKLVEKVIAPYEDLYSVYEEQSIYWNDEAEFILSMVLKTIKSFEKTMGENAELLPEFKDDDDLDFVKTLFRKTILNHSESYDLIKKFTKNWDLERVAFIDIVLMQMALAEILEFPHIPVNVTLNEYIEIAKHYSTSKSGTFINGILDKIVEHWNSEKVIMKPVK
jgi:N utilization substance protein B